MRVCLIILSIGFVLTTIYLKLVGPMDYKLFESIREMGNHLQNNKPRLVQAGSKNICVIKQDDRLIAFENECPHMSEPLHRGKINTYGEITCPWHAYRFSIINGEEAEGRCGALRMVEVVSTEEGIFLRF